MGFIQIYCRKWRKFWRGEAPGYHHRIIHARLIKKINMAWMALFYFLVLTPISFLLRMKYSFLAIEKRKTYWKSKKIRGDYEKLY